MPKIFYTDLDIENLVKNGVTRLDIRDENIVLTDLAFEKARKLGLVLVRHSQAETDKSGFSQDNVSAPGRLMVEYPEFPQAPDINRNVLRFAANAPEKDLRNAIVETGKIAYRSGLMVSNDGNISVRMADGNVLITPSGVCKGRIKAEDLLVIDLQGNMVKRAADPSLKPTSEQPMHLEVYRQRQDVRAVIHTHLIYANALAISRGTVRMDVIPEAAIAFGKIPITDFAMPSTSQNADAVRELILKHDVLLIRNHGSLTVGKDLDEALIKLERLEHVSKTLTFAELLGDVNTLPPHIMEAIAQITEQARNAK